MRNQLATDDLYWGVGGALLTLGMLRRAPRGNLAVGAGLVILGVKMREWLAALPAGQRES